MYCSSLISLIIQDLTQQNYKILVAKSNYKILALKIRMI